LARKALAGLGLSTLTAGGDFHPALRTSAARYEQPDGNYAHSVARGASEFVMAYPHVPMTRAYFLQAGNRRFGNFRNLKANF
jgi:hypothetical protein